MKYLLNIEFDKNKDIGVLEASLALISKTKKRHDSNNCMTTLFCFNEYRIYLQGHYSFLCKKTDKKYSLSDIIKLRTVEEINHIIINPDYDNDFKNNSCAYLYIKNEDMTTVKEIKILRKNPMETLADSLDHLRDFFLLESRMAAF